MSTGKSWTGDAGYTRRACLSYPPYRRYQRTNAEAQVSPAPNAPNITNWPSLTRPSRTASSNAMGMEAADVLP